MSYLEKVQSLYNTFYIFLHSPLSFLYTLLYINTLSSYIDRVGFHGSQILNGEKNLNWSKETFQVNFRTFNMRLRPFSGLTKEWKWEREREEKEGKK